MLLETIGIGFALPIISIFTDINNLSNNEYAIFIEKYIGNFEKTDLLLGLVIFVVFFYTIKAATLSIIAWQLAKFTYDTQKEISKDLFERYIKLNYSEFNKINTSVMLKNIIKESQIFAMQFIMPSLNLLAELLVLFGILLLLFYIEPVGTLICLIALCFPAIIFYIFTNNRIKKVGELRTNYDSKRIQFSNEAFGVFKNIKLGNLEDFFLNKFNFHNHGTAIADTKLTIYTQLPRIFLEWCTVLAICGLVSFLYYKNLSSSEFVSFLGIFGLAAYRLMPSINRILISLNLIKYTDKIVNNIHSELYKRENVILRDQKNKVEFRESIAINNLHFTYEARNELINNINLSITKGMHVGIKGESGVGKSTFVDLLLGLLKPQSGQISVDGVNINKLGSSWTGIIGYVPQNIYLIDGSIKENIALGIKDIDNSKIFDALEKSSLSKFVSELRDGIDTNVGEIGSNLSGGQIQRLGIARAIYNNPQILIFDESTSALDLKTEKGILDTINKMQNNKTIIMISHKESALKGMDYIYKLERGKLDLI